MKHQVDVAHLDRNGQLWLGSDRGEWGGRIARIDLHDGRIQDYHAACRIAAEQRNREVWGESLEQMYEEYPDELGCDGVYGFIERSDGDIWAYGGMSHMGMNSGYIAHLAGDSVTLVKDFGVKASRDNEEPPPNEPRMPITRMLELGGDQILVFSYGKVFQADAKLENWKPFHEIRLRYLPGRPNAVGSYPAITEAQTVRQNPPEVICSTLRDGLVRISGDSETRHSIANQLGAVSVGRIEPSNMGLMVVDGRRYWGMNAPWTLKDGQWRPVELLPQIKLDDNHYWMRNEAFVDREGAIVLVFFTNYSRGRSVTYRLDRGSESNLGEQESESSSFFGDAFVTPDGEWWVTDGLTLLRHSGERWQPTAQLPGEERPYQRGYHPFRVIPTSTQPWLLHDHRNHELWKLEYGSDPERPRASRIFLAETGEPKVYGGVVLKDDTVLLATSQGLGLLPSVGEAMRPFSRGRPQLEKVRAVGRDDSDRLWFGGSGLWVLDEHNNLHDLSAIPIFEGAEVLDLVADAAQPSGMAVSLGERGLVLVHAAR